MLYVEEKKLNEFKAMVKEKKSQLVAERRKLEQEIKDFRKLKNLSDESEGKRIDMFIEERKQQIAKIRFELMDYSFPITQVLPVRYGDNIYNYKMLQEIKKKLKGFLLDININELGVMFIEYSKPGTFVKGSYRINPIGYVGAFTLQTPVATLES